MKFLMRLQKSFNKEIDDTKKQDFFVDINGCKVRVVKVILKTGEVETLITNLSKISFKQADFKGLYALRWGVETKYNSLKNKLDIETFCGKSVNCILQDFYATLYLSNLVAFIKFQTDDIICENSRDKNLKYEYKTNENLLIGTLKNRFICICLLDDPLEREASLNELVRFISSYKVAISPNRHFPRPASSHKKITQKLKKAL